MARYALSISNSISAEPRGRLKLAAEWLFAERGFHRLSLRQLVSEVGLYPGSLYAHFDSKDSLLTHQGWLRRLARGCPRRPVSRAARWCA